MRASAALLALSMLLAASVVRAQAPAHPPPSPQAMAQARELFTQGAAAYDAARYGQALDLFHRSYELSHEPRLLYNVGLAADRLRHDDEAITAFQGYLDGVPDADNRDVVTARLVILRDAAAQRARADARHDLTPADVARQDQGGGAPSERQDDGGLLAQWWFWTLVGVVVVAVGVGVAVGVATSSGGKLVERMPTAGDDGRIITTLGSP